MSNEPHEQRLQKAVVTIVEAIAEWFAGKATLYVGDTKIKLKRAE